MEHNVLKTDLQEFDVMAHNASAPYVQRPKIGDNIGEKQPSPITSKKARRPSQSKPLWRVHRHLKCPVIGACLSIEEHRRLVRKLGYQTKRLSDYEVHKGIMENLDKENNISIKIDSYLRHKYRKSISTLFDLDAEAFMEKWRALFKQGQIDGPFYVAAVRNDLSEANIKEIFGEIHMLSHAHVGEIMNTRKQLTTQIEANHKLARCLKQEKEQQKKLRQENSHLKASLHKLNHLKQQCSDKSSDTRVLKEKERKVRNLEAENITLKEENKRLEHQNTEQIRVLENKNQSLRQEISELKRLRQKLTDEMDSLISQFSQVFTCNNKCSEACPEFQLCARRILIVGGITRIRHLYKHLIESAGGEFDYHNGYMKHGIQNLEVRVRRSDLIICPVDCNSHGAALNVKKLCRKHNKQVRMIPGSSLSAIRSAVSC